jgi:hypothetical protein
LTADVGACVAAWLDAALAHAGRTHRLEDVRALVEAGEAQLWASEHAAMVTVIEEDPLERRLLIWLAGGDLDDLVRSLRPQAEDWARRQGCRRVVVIGRAGWERALAPEGYAPLARIIAKDL